MIRPASFPAIFAGACLGALSPLTPAAFSLFASFALRFAGACLGGRSRLALAALPASMRFCLHAAVA